MLVYQYHSNKLKQNIDLNWVAIILELLSNNKLAKDWMIKFNLKLSASLEIAWFYVFFCIQNLQCNVVKHIVVPLLH